MAFTMRALGYPSREALTDWTTELHPEPRRKLVTKAANVLHTPAHMAAAVLDFFTRQSSATAVAKSAAVRRYKLYKWKSQLLGREAPTSMKEKTTDIPEVDVTQLTELQQQVVSLQRDIRRLQLEHDRLKKAN
jgi:putative transposase